MSAEYVGYKLTPKIVRAYHAHMCNKFDAILIQKHDAPEMRIVDWGLAMMGIGRRGWFLDNFATSIGNRIYVPWTPGDGNSQELAKQVRVLAHECRHVSQFKEDRRFALRYLLSKSRRAHFEADAMHADLEVFWGLFGAAINVNRLVRPLKHYRLRRADISRVKRELMVYNHMVAGGAVGTREAKEAIRFLRKATK